MSTDNAIETMKFCCRDRDGDRFCASAVYIHGDFIVLKGSRIFCHVRNRQFVELHKDALNAEYILIKDVCFTFATKAARFVSGGLLRNNAWFAEDGRSFENVMNGEMSPPKTSSDHHQISSCEQSLQCTSLHDNAIVNDPLEPDDSELDENKLLDNSGNTQICENSLNDEYIQSADNMDSVLEHSNAGDNKSNNSICGIEAFYYGLQELINQNIQSAARWFKLSADEGNIDSQSIHAIFYRSCSDEIKNSTGNIHPLTMMMSAIKEYKAGHREQAMHDMLNALSFKRISTDSSQNANFKLIDMIDFLKFDDENAVTHKNNAPTRSHSKLNDDILNILDELNHEFDLDNDTLFDLMEDECFDEDENPDGSDEESDFELDEERMALVTNNMRFVKRIILHSYLAYTQSTSLTFDDLYQEGCIGLMHAAKAFDPEKGKFLSYAYFWIHQAIRRSIFNFFHLIRIPTHMMELVFKYKKISLNFENLYSREPTSSEMAQELHCSETDVEKIKRCIRITDDCVDLYESSQNKDDSMPSLIPEHESRRLMGICAGESEEKTIGIDKFAYSELDLDFMQEEQPYELADTLEDISKNSPEEAYSRQCLAELTKELIKQLPHRTAVILSERFGLEDGQEHTLEELGQKFGCTRERIRQIEKKVLNIMAKSPRFRILSEFNED